MLFRENCLLHVALEEQMKGQIFKTMVISCACIKADAGLRSDGAAEQRWAEHVHLCVCTCVQLCAEDRSSCTFSGSRQTLSWCNPGDRQLLCIRSCWFGSSPRFPALHAAGYKVGESPSLLWLIPGWRGLSVTVVPGDMRKRGCLTD